jgi:hypothetical protein
MERQPIPCKPLAQHTKDAPNGETLAQHIARSTLAERIEAVRVVGVDNLWDSMLAPIVGQRG